MAFRKSKKGSRKRVYCVDIKGKKILNLKKWKEEHPKQIYFESEFERQAYIMFNAAGLNFDFQPPARELIPPLKTLALSKGKTKKLFLSSVRPITYTTDFAIYCDDGTTVFVETKGFFHPDARLRYKLFQHTLTSKEISLLAFDTYTAKGKDRMTDVKAIIKIIKENYTNQKTTNTIDI